MNILFITDCDADPMRGGIDRIVGTLAGALATQSGCRCFLLYFHKTQNGQTAPFDLRQQTCAATIGADLPAVIARHGIERIIVSTSQKRLTRAALPAAKAAACGRDIPVLFWFHGMPGYELVPLDRRVAWFRLWHNPRKMLTAMKLLQSSFGFLKPLMRWRLKKKYAFYGRFSDRIVVLAKPYVGLFAALADIPESHFVAINNILTFDCFADRSLILQKEPLALVVARLDEESKRIALILRIWRQIEQQSDLAWRLQIVGTGEDEPWLKRLAQRLGLTRCEFVGRRDPKDCYLRASIFLMASSNEGFPMTLGEAQQTGAVPVAFDSFGAVHEIIRSGVNGYIVADGDIDGYVRCLSALMRDDALRQAAAMQAVESSRRFAGEKILREWETVLYSLL